MNSEDLEVELTTGRPSYMVLRGTYGKKTNEAFGMTRQGVRWRFQRLFNEIYVSAYETIFWIESNFGTDLRQKAIEIAKERVAMRKNAQEMSQFEFSRLKKSEK